MCGILGIFEPNINIPKSITALDTMNHRGPDATGYISLDNVFLGHKRLSIIDTSDHANQPFHRNDFVLIFNGEIYNYKELITEHRLIVKTKSDTEVLIAMYEKHGEKCLAFFNGMFSFIIYNKVNKNVFVARDRLGIKPLYFRKSNLGVQFSSEIDALITLKPELFDDFGIRQYKKLRMTVKGHTIYQNIETFPAGHYYLNGKITKYWDLDIQSKPAPKDEEVKHLIEDAIALRKRADVPLGTYLSGGLDSTITSYLLKPAHTWTVGFDELNEFDWSSIAAQGLPGTHHCINIDKAEFLKTAQWMVSKRKEPLSVPNEVLIYLMTKKVKSKNTVVISGEGADELFLGYDRIFKWANSAKCLSVSDFDEKYCYGSHEDNEVIDYALENIPGNTVLDKIAYYFQTTHLQGLLRRVDNSTMLCSVEARVPFVDHRLVELIAGTPFDWRMGNSFKEPLKRIYADLIPQSIIDRKKVGFPVPLSSIFNENQNKTSMDNWLNFNLSTLNNSL